MVGSCYGTTMNMLDSGSNGGDTDGLRLESCRLATWIPDVSPHRYQHLLGRVIVSSQSTQAIVPIVLNMPTEYFDLPRELRELREVIYENFLVSPTEIRRNGFVEAQCRALSTFTAVHSENTVPIPYLSTI